MARVDNLTNFLTDVAGAIKTKKGYPSSQKIAAADFDTEINNINTVNNQNKTVSPSTSQQSVTADNNYTGLGTVTVNAVTNDIDANITQNNIKKDVTILGVTGTYEGIDTSDATATSQDLAKNVTAYVNGTKITGSIKTLANQGYTLAGTTVLPYNGGITVGGGHFPEDVLVRHNNVQVMMNAENSTITTAVGLTADKLKKGVTILGVTGTYEGSGGSDIPAGCKKIEYIQSTGTQYIDLQASCPDGFKIATLVNFTTRSQNQVLCGAEGSSSSPQRNYIKLQNSNKFELGANTYYPCNYTLPNTYTTLLLRASTVKSQTYFTLTDTQITSVTNTDPRTSNGLVLFANRNNTVAFDYSYAKLYYFKLYDAVDVLIRDFIPIKDSNDVACLYDRVSNTIFYNAGTGTFTAGPET